MWFPPSKSVPGVSIVSGCERMRKGVAGSGIRTARAAAITDAWVRACGLLRIARSEGRQERGQRYLLLSLLRFLHLRLPVSRRIFEYVEGYGGIRAERKRGARRICGSEGS